MEERLTLQQSLRYGLFAPLSKVIIQLNHRSNMTAVRSSRRSALKSDGASALRSIECVDKLINRNAALFQQSRQSTRFDLMMMGHHTTLRAFAKNDMATALTHDDKTQALQGADRLSTRNNRQARHVRQFGMLSAMPDRL